MLITTDNGVFDTKFLICAFLALKFGIIGLKRRLLLAFMPFGESQLYRDFANPKTLFHIRSKRRKR